MASDNNIIVISYRTYPPVLTSHPSLVYNGSAPADVIMPTAWNDKPQIHDYHARMLVHEEKVRIGMQRAQG